MTDAAGFGDEDGEAGVGLGDEIAIVRLLWALDRGLSASSKQMDVRLGLTGLQRLVIRTVGRHPGISAGRLAAILCVHPSTLTSMLGRLVERDLLTRTGDPSDARRALFGLSAQGRKVDAMRSGTIEAKLGEVLARLPARDVAVTRKVLGVLAEALASPAGARASAARLPQGRGTHGAARRRAGLARPDKETPLDVKRPPSS